MNLAETRIALRPRGLGEIMDLGLRFDHAIGGRLYRRLALVLLLPAYLLCLALRFWVDLPWEQVWLVAAGLVLCTQGAFTIAASRLLVAPDVRVTEVLGRFLRRLPSYLVSSVLALLVLGLGWTFFYFLVTAYFATTSTTHYHEASLVEEAGPLAALSRSRALARHNGMRVFGLQVLRVAALVGFVVVFELVFSVGLVEFGLQLGRPFGRLEWGGSPFALAGLFAGVPYYATTRFLHYIDTRTRQDGWDVQVRCMSIAAADEAEREVAA
jgi:hypothetical protein